MMLGASPAAVTHYKMKRIMASEPLRRAFARVRPPGRAVHPEVPPGSATGGYDRTHDGLVSGWFTCPACGTPPTPIPDLLIDGRPSISTNSTTPRGDIPGGLGFLCRFTPTGAPAAHLRIQCRVHQEHGLDLDVPPGVWAAPALAAIEHSTWPIVTGWAALLSGTDGSIRLTADGCDAISVRTSVRRPDVQVYLGFVGVGGFHVDLGAMLGYALPDTTRIRLVLDEHCLAEAIITDSPLGEDTLCSLPPSPPLVESMSDASIGALRRRFRDAEIETSGDWREIIDRLGQREYSAETEQWADYLSHRGLLPRQVSAWLALRATYALGVPALNPLPADLDAIVDLTNDSLPQIVRTWTETILGIQERAITQDVLTAPALVQTLDLPDRQVAVAGLVHHKSGLGQNARNSIKALELAGIHACHAPFFPAPGGWNPRLGPTRGAVRSLEDHIVLLHLPIDQVIPSLAAQPALLRTDRLIGYFMWELETVPRQFHRALNVVDEIWTATEFVADAFRNATDTPVYVTGHAVDVSCVEQVNRSEVGIREDAFVVHYAFDANSTVGRKNPNAAFDAFHSAFGDDPAAVFVLKIRNFQQVESLARNGDPHAKGLLTRLSGGSRVVLLTGEWSYARSLGLIQAADCYLSLHRSEGFGYSICEAIALGTTVVATNYSGNVGLIQGSSSRPVDFVMRDLWPGEYFYWEPGLLWAEPLVQDAVEILKSLRDGHELANGRRHGVGEEFSEAFSLGGLSEKYSDVLAGARHHRAQGDRSCDG